MQTISSFIVNYLLLCCILLEGLSCLRLVKVEIPPYKFRGESALLECVYELNGGQVVGGGGGSHLRARGREDYGPGAGQYYSARYRQQSPMDYINHPEEAGADDVEDRGVVEEEFKYAKRKRKKYGRLRKYDVEEGEEDDDEDDEHDEDDDLVLGGDAGRAADPYHQQKHKLVAAVDEDVDAHEDDLIEDMVQAAKGGSGFPEALYSVKWYKDNEEFYRYVPKANPPQNSYKVEGVRVDHKYSDSTRVMLRQITIKSTGHYRCEISAEAPNFASIQGEGHMEVVYLPKDGPHIAGERRIYNPGDLLHLNCSSGKSHPASSLHWFINNVQVTDHNLIVRYPRLIHMYGLITTRIGLNLPLQSSFFHKSKAVVKCTSTISPGFWGSSSSSSSSSITSSIVINGVGGRKESLAQATRHHSVIDSREDTFIVHSGGGCHKAAAVLSSSVIVFMSLRSCWWPLW